jgi:protein glucosyltransferase
MTVLRSTLVGLLLLLAGLAVIKASVPVQEQECQVNDNDNDDPLDFYRDVAVAQLEPWRETGIDKALLERTLSLGHRWRSAHCQIIDGHLCRSPEPCLFPSRCEGVEHFLLKILHDAPNTEIVVNMNDRPLTNASDPLPVFSFSTTPGAHSDVLCPNWAFWEGGPWLKEMPTWRWDLNRHEPLEAGDATPWPEKQDAVFFRGSRTNDSRDSLVLHSHDHPDRWDIRFTLNQDQDATRHTTETLGIEPAPHVPPREHCKHRCLLNFDGVAASFRLRDMLACGSTVHSKLHPWEHFMPLDLDGMKSQKVVDFLWAHPDPPQRVASGGRDFIENHLTMGHVEQCWLHVLREHASLQRFQPERNAKCVEIV